MLLRIRREVFLKVTNIIDQMTCPRQVTQSHQNPLLTAGSMNLEIYIYLEPNYLHLHMLIHFEFSLISET